LEAFSKDTLADWFHEKQITSKFSIAAILLSDLLVDQLRLQIKRLSGVKVELEYLRTLLSDEVVKRELVDGDEANSACAFVKKLQRRVSAKRVGSAEDDEEKADTSEQTADSDNVPAIPVTIAAEL
jgi:hypothetical protein